MAIKPREMKEMEKLMDSVPREMERFMYSLVGDVEMVLDFPEEMEKTLLPPARYYVKNTKAMFLTPADIYEHPDPYHFVLDMPGLQVENIEVKVENGVLHVVGKKKKEEVEPIRRQRRRARYMRKFTLPKNAEPENVTATYKVGVLTVVVAKKQAEEAPSKPKTINIPVLVL